jgi:3-phenylpropionate/trans-cinnamate dioxygenase ferredoxin reductase component
MRRRLLVVGGSYAACELASSARENGYDEHIVIVSEEDELSYRRPPLSKTFLKGRAEDTWPIRAGPRFSISPKVNKQTRPHGRYTAWP